MKEIPLQIKADKIRATKLTCEITLNFEKGNIFNPIKDTFEIDVDIPILPNS